MHSIRVAWAAADIEHAGHRWIAGRELALAPDGWGAEIANERGGYSRRLPDLVFWPARDPRRQAAVVIAPGLTNPRRQRAALEGWQRSILAGQYAQVHYLAGPAFVSHLRGVAEDIGLPPRSSSSANASSPTSFRCLPVIESVDKESAA